MLDAQLTTCLDLDSGALVQIPAAANESALEVLRRRSYRGIKRLICALCWDGVDTAARTEVPLLLREHTGTQGAHFAHPAGRAPRTGQHSADMMRQLAVRADLQQWALQQPGVSAVRTALSHQVSGGGQQVVVEFGSGHVVVLRVQGESLAQGQWLRERAQYADAGVVDEWLWASSADGGWLGNSAVRWEIGGDTALVAAIASAGGGVRRYGVAPRELGLTVEGLQGPRVALRDDPADLAAAGPIAPTEIAAEAPRGADGSDRPGPRRSAAVEYQGMPVVDLDAVLGHDAAVEIGGRGAGMDIGRAAQLVYKTLGLYEECALAPLAAEFGERCPHALGVLQRYGYLELLDRGGIPKIRRTARGRRCGRAMTEPRSHAQLTVGIR